MTAGDACSPLLLSVLMGGVITLCCSPWMVVDAIRFCCVPGLLVDAMGSAPGLLVDAMGCAPVL